MRSHPLHLKTSSWVFLGLSSSLSAHSPESSPTATPNHQGPKVRCTLNVGMARSWGTDTKRSWQSPSTCPGPGQAVMLLLATPSSSGRWWSAHWPLKAPTPQPALPQCPPRARLGCDAATGHPHTLQEVVECPLAAGGPHPTDCRGSQSCLGLCVSRLGGWGSHFPLQPQISDLHSIYTLGCALGNCTRPLSGG